LITKDNIVKVVGTIVLLIMFGTACKKNEDTLPADPGNTVPTGKLEKLDEFHMNIAEPSGLSFGRTKQSLFTVSDNSNKVYEMDLQGNVIRELAYTGEDLEGITCNPDDNVLAVVEERKREVVFLNYETGAEINRYKINVKEGDSNKGLEGISWNTNNRAYYLLNENNPALMMVWKPDAGIISEVDMNFAYDYSGIYADSENSFLWIVSDESQMLYRCNYNAKVLEKYELNFSKAEGIAVDYENNRIYVISDKLSKLFVYKMVN
jgi:uncharacterized protein YjiK